MLHGAAAQLAADTGVRQWHISLSHTASVAEAFVIAE
jgi:holo-[acyl-carrier protein] synthase